MALESVQLIFQEYPVLDNLTAFSNDISTQHRKIYLPKISPLSIAFLALGLSAILGVLLRVHDNSRTYVSGRNLHFLLL
jgi:hypothetical protein